MKKQSLAFVLAGGGSRGALQVGALRALLEAGYKPDMLVGTSVGAVNGTFLAWHGCNLSAIDELEQTWREVEKYNPLPANFLWLTVRSLFNRPVEHTTYRLKDFLLAQGLSPHWRFRDIQGVQLFLVSADLNSGRMVIFGDDPDQSVSEGVLASTALPPWAPPIEKHGNMLIDGGVVSNCPIQVAIDRGASEIIALDLTDPRGNDPQAHGFGPFLGKLVNTIEQRQLELELSLASAVGIRVYYLQLIGNSPVPLWDFHHTAELMSKGYEITRNNIAQWQAEKEPSWYGRIASGIRNIFIHS